MAAAATGAGAALNAVGSLVSGAMTSNSLNEQANFQNQQANEAIDQGQYNAFRQGVIANQRIGQISANYGASGVRENSGSVQNVLAASATNSELDRLNILHQADLKATNYENQAALDQFGAKSATLGSIFSAAGAGAQGFGKLESMRTTPTVADDSSMASPYTGSKQLVMPQIGQNYNQGYYGTSSLLDEEEF